MAQRLRPGRSVSNQTARTSTHFSNPASRRGSTRKGGSRTPWTRRHHADAADVLSRLRNPPGRSSRRAGQLLQAGKNGRCLGLVAAPAKDRALQFDVPTPISGVRALPGVPVGTKLIYSTYLGSLDKSDGSSTTGGGIAVDKFHHANVVGYTSSTDFPLCPGFSRLAGSAPCTSPNNGTPLQSTNVGGALVAELTSGGTQLDYATDLGQRLRDWRHYVSGLSHVSRSPDNRHRWLRSMHHDRHTPPEKPSGRARCLRQ